MPLDINNTLFVRFEFFKKNGRLSNSDIKGSLEYLWDIYTKPEDRVKIIQRHYPKLFFNFENTDK